MKTFQTLLFLVVIILIGGIAALYWSTSIEDATTPVVVEEVSQETIVSLNEEQSEPEGISMYSNALLGFTFQYSESARVSEDTELDGFDTGKRSTVRVFDPQYDLIFSAEALSSD
ncbi:MAG: hypothetical protein NUV84_04835, partial [Candidatus Uhrbacteria bacterium]|nr:hypothetical protein [Candidatus Uhrbacteria bacterium]